jgi:hypothetical protein
LNYFCNLLLRNERPIAPGYSTANIPKLLNLNPEI